MFRRLAYQVYLPWVLAQLGRGMLLTLLPLYLRDVGLTYGMVSVVIAAAGAGAVLGGLPIGSSASRFGPEKLFVVACAVMAVTSAALGLTEAVVGLVIFHLLYGAGAFGLRVSTQTLLTYATPASARGKAMSYVGGSVRFASFLGPILGGVLIDVAGFTVAFAGCGVVTIAGLGMFLFAGREGSSTVSATAAAPRAIGRGLIPMLVRHRRLLLLAGVGPALVMTVRAGRNVVVPLIGEDFGLGATAIGVLVAIGTGADLLLFPVAGWLMDRFGRLHSIVPAFGMLGIGMLVLGVAGTSGMVVAAGIIMGVGNGMSSGTMLTLGADLAPKGDPGPFLSAIGTLQDVGGILGPILVGLFAERAGLGASAIVLAIVMFLAIAWIVIVLGDTSRPSRPWLVPLLDDTSRDH